jgi:2-keto-4-pentenoate hydratase/2-oxohepta-3-ene-1,7-dioic acid hydratase in catechol pathway
MRLCRYDQGSYGVVAGDDVHDITAVVERIVGRAGAVPGDAVVANIDQIKAIVSDPSDYRARPLAEVKLLSPVAHPTKLVCAPVNYKAHIAEMRADKSVHNPARSSDIGEAGLFLKANSAMVGPSEGVALRFLNRRNDHELEIVLVIGRRGSNIPQERALDHVAGYTMGLDMTLRGPEDRSFRKSIDSYAVIGPWLTTADEIADPDDLSFTLKVNGEVRQNARAADMVYGIRRLIEYASSFYTLWPGDIIYTGSPEGVSPVKPGDVMLAESPALGRMEVRVRAAEA